MSFTYEEISQVERESGQRNLNADAYSFRSTFEYIDKSGAIVRAKAKYSNGTISVVYRFPSGKIKINSPVLEDFFKLQAKPSRRSALAVSQAGRLGRADLRPIARADAIDQLESVITPKTEILIENLKKTVASSSRLRTPLFDSFQGQAGQRDLMGWACGALLIGFDAGAGLTIGACAGCPVGAPLCGPCLAGLAGMFGLGAGAAATCQSYLDGIGAGSSGDTGGGDSQVECYQLDDDTVICVDPEGHVVEIHP